nr:unnamed protein product [Leishmania braziliensis]
MNSSSYITDTSTLSFAKFDENYAPLAQCGITGGSCGGPQRRPRSVALLLPNAAIARRLRNEIGRMCVCITHRDNDERRWPPGRGRLKVFSAWRRDGRAKRAARCIGTSCRGFGRASPTFRSRCPNAGWSTPRATCGGSASVSSATNNRLGDEVVSAPEFRTALCEVRAETAALRAHAPQQCPPADSPQQWPPPYGGCRARIRVVYTTRGAQEASAAPSPLLGSAFTVVEEKKGRLRRRLPLWPRQASRWLEKSIVTQPRELVLDECGGVTELTASLLQVLLPLHLRALFSLRARGGSVHQ